MSILQKMATYASSRFLNQDEDGGADTDDFKQDISQQDRDWIVETCKSLNEWDDNVCMLWIRKIKKEAHKREKRITVITAHRLFTVRKQDSRYNIRRVGHLLDLLSVQETGLQITIRFRDFGLSFQCEETMVKQVLHTLFKNYHMINPGFPVSIACQWLDQYGASQMDRLQNRVPVRVQDRGPWEKICRGFYSYCSYYEVPTIDGKVRGLESILSSPIHPDEDRILRTSDLGIEKEEVMVGLIRCVSFSTILDGIEISDTNTSADLLAVVQFLLTSNNHLRSIVIEGNAHAPDWGGLLREALNGNQSSNLREFGLKNCRIGDAGVKLWIQGNQQLARQPQSIALTKAGASVKTLCAFINTLIGTNEIGTGLVELDLSDNELGTKGTQVLANRIQYHFQDLKVLKLARTGLDTPRLLMALNSGSHLEELDVSHNRMSSKDGLLLSRLLATSHTTASLSIAYCGLPGEVIAAVCASLLMNDELQFYVRLDLSGNQIQTESAIVLASLFANSDRLMSVKLNNCDMGHEGMGYIMHSLELQPRLRILELDNNCKRAQWSSGKYHVDQELKNLLERCLNLESLSVKNDPERGYQIDLDRFLQSLKFNSNLLALDISGNSLTPDNLNTLKDVVVKNSCLQELHWDQNNINSEHIVTITHALKQNTALQLVEFPERDFQAELATIDRRDTRRRMELQMIKSNFYKALFENNTQAGFQASAVSIKRKSAKRASVLPNLPPGVRNIRQFEELQQQARGATSLGIPMSPPM